MKRTLGILTLSLVAGLSVTAALADDTTTTTTDTTSKTVVKKKNPIVRGADAVGSDTKKVGHAVEHGTQTVVKDTGKGVKAMGRGLRKLVPFKKQVKTTTTTTTPNTDAK